MSGSHSNVAEFSEEEYGKKLNRCFTDTVVKGCGGLLIGTVIALLFLRRRVFPVFIGAGFGIGLAYKTCEKDLNSL